MPPIVLKIQGNETFLPFSNLDQDELSKTWRVCTKVKDSLENGSRLENLSWRLWFIQNVLVSNDVKSRSKYQSWSTHTTKKMENESELEPTTALYNNSQKTTSFISPPIPQTIQQEMHEPKSVLDYSLDEIKPVGTENFILNQFTSDQQDDQMIELKDIFPINMQDFMCTAPEKGPESDNQIIGDNPSLPYDNLSSWQQAQNNPIDQNSTYYNKNNQISPQNTIPYASSTAPSSCVPTVLPSATTQYNTQINSRPNYPTSTQPNFLVDPISGIHSLFADHMEIPAMNIPTDPNNQNIPQPNLVVDFNNAAYVAAAAAATAAALTTLPNATLHNKLLATLPRQTLASAERLLSPASRRPTTVVQTQQQQQTRMVESLPQTNMSIDSSQNDRSKKQKQQHYYGTFQLDTGNPLPTMRHNNSSDVVLNSYNNNNSSSASSEHGSMSDEKQPQCSNCDATSTPLWRRSADDKVLCNACGLYLKLHNVPRPKHLKASNGKGREDKMFGGDDYGSDNDDTHASSQQPQMSCTNCGTNKTPLWRRDAAGKALCNACGLYFKLHNENRPLSMKTDVIKKRQRAETLIASSNTADGASDNSKKPRYYDQQSLFSTSENGTVLGYRQAASSLPGTGILMMTPDTSSSA